MQVFMSKFLSSRRMALYDARVVVQSLRFVVCWLLLNSLTVSTTAGGEIDIPADVYENNSGLCGRPLSPCTNQHHRSLKFDYSFKSGFVIGYVFTAVSVIAVYVFYFIPWLPVKKENKMMKKKNKRKEANQLFKSPTSELFLEETKESLLLERFVTRWSFRKLSEATDHFSQHNVIGVGKLGTVYKASLSNGWPLVIKKFRQSHHCEESFLSEINVLGKLRHDNLVPLLGFSVESEERLLVYKYMSNGNLHDWLHSAEYDAKILEWPLRIKIAVGLARGLAWLHHGSNFSVVHLRLSSKCILLDRSFEPKISNFERALLLQPRKSDSTVSSKLISELGFIKKDVHGFGKVLLELVVCRVLCWSDLLPDGVLGNSVRQLTISVNTMLLGLESWEQSTKQASQMVGLLPLRNSTTLVTAWNHFYLKCKYLEK